ncbi:SDR family NAD(P)-dependent oxidoreductase [Enterococcus nangangensis]|uniref:SDR family NAD(P)-dependent oxidoreductase n=1 Tax=Enterococcus nangangensis TaxID=2559926 RepID=UPI0010F5EF4E|nr:SDR family oxidoreductase [Enterococcus nangangensis]
MNLQDKVVLVTGGSSGIGEKICLAAAKKGATVIVCARRIQLVGQVKNTCSELAGKPCYGYQLDIANPESVDSLLAKVAEEVGQVDILVNCAGFGLFENFIEMDYQTIEKMFAVNVLGLMYLTQAIGLTMAKEGHGQIINIASQAGKMATPKSAVYSATKFAVLGFSNGLRLELKPYNVQVMTVNPGPIATDFFQKADPSGNYLAQVDWLVLEPEKLANKIVANFGTHRREINAPWFMEGASRFYTLFPHLGDYLAGTLFNQK